MSKINPVTHEVVVRDLGDAVDLVNKNMESVMNQFANQDKQIRRLKTKSVFGKLIFIAFAGYCFYKFQDQDLKYEALDKDIRRMKEESEKE